MTSDSAYEAAGFLSSNTSTTAGNVTTSGFSIFGGQLVYSDGSDIESQFWAKTTDVDGVWGLMWNEDGTSQDDSVPVTLKTTAPVTQAAADKL